jgi:short-subunit dehydrogenase
MAPLVLVTGANGFIGAHIFTQLVDRGYSVRGTVRSIAKRDFLLNKFPEAVRSGQISFHIVPDISKPHAFRGALTGESIYVVALTGLKMSNMLYMLRVHFTSMSPTTKRTITNQLSMGLRGFWRRHYLKRVLRELSLRALLLLLSTPKST